MNPSGCLPALRLLRSLGVPLNLRRDATWYDGKRIAAGPAVTIPDVLHEAAHWIVAGKRWRGLVNYGLGIDPDYATPDRYLVREGLVEGDMNLPVHHPNDQDVEHLASGLGILMLGVLGGNTWSELKHHSWDTAPTLRALEDMKKAARIGRRFGVSIPGALLSDVLNQVKNLRGH